MPGFGLVLKQREKWPDTTTSSWRLPRLNVAARWPRSTGDISIQCRGSRLWSRSYEEHGLLNQHPFYLLRQFEVPDASAADDAFAVHHIEPRPTVVLPDGRDWTVAAVLERRPGHAELFGDGLGIFRVLVGINAEDRKGFFRQAFLKFAQCPDLGTAPAAMAPEHQQDDLAAIIAQFQFAAF